MNKNLLSLLCNIWVSLCCASLVWAQNYLYINSNSFITEKIPQDNNLLDINSHASLIFKKPEILNPFNKAALENCIFLSKFLKGLLPPAFDSCFKFSFESHSHDTKWANLGYHKIPFYCTVRYSVILDAIYIWNHLQSCHQNLLFHQLRGFFNRYN